MIQLLKFSHIGFCSSNQEWCSFKNKTKSDVIAKTITFSL